MFPIVRDKKGNLHLLSFGPGFLKVRIQNVTRS
jgi:hypothetical protein